MSETVAAIERRARATNPEDHRQRTDRFDATWGQKRIVRKGTMYEKHYADLVDDVEPVIEYESVSQKQQTIINAKHWAYKAYPKLDRDDISQEIEIKAWSLEDHELDERGEWHRPPYVMTALKNAVHDYAREQIGYEKSTKVTADVIVRTRFDAPAADEEIMFTAKTLKAGLLLFVAAPSTLSLLTKDRLYSVYRQLSNAEHKALLQCVLEPTDSSIRSLDRLVSKFLKSTNE